MTSIRNYPTEFFYQRCVEPNLKNIYPTGNDTNTSQMVCSNIEASLYRVFASIPECDKMGAYMTVMELLGQYGVQSPIYYQKRLRGCMSYSNGQLLDSINILLG